MEIASGRAHIRTGPRTRIVDLRGSTVVPGIIDNHNHLVLMGNRPGYHTPLENAHSIAEALATIAARVAEVPRDAWITTIGGFHTNHLYANPADKTTGRFPTLAELDSVAPNNPVWLSISFNGPSVTNTAGRNILHGRVVDGQPINVAADGAIAGSGGQSTRALLYLRQTLLNPEERRRSTLDAMKYAASLGVTTHIDQGAFQATNTAGRRRGARRQLHDALPVPRDVRAGQGPGAAAHQLPAHGDRRCNARAGAAPEERLPVLRRRHGEDRRHRRVHRARDGGSGPLPGSGAQGSQGRLARRGALARPPRHAHERADRTTSWRSRRSRPSTANSRASSATSAGWSRTCPASRWSGSTN